VVKDWNLKGKKYDNKKRKQTIKMQLDARCGGGVCWKWRWRWGTQQNSWKLCWWMRKKKTTEKYRKKKKEEQEEGEEGEGDKKKEWGR
jgi:hypothetical protein